MCPVWSRWPEAIRLFARGVTLRPCVPVAVVVGIGLSAANEGPLLAVGDLGWQGWIRVAVSFMVPFLVASHGFLRGGPSPRSRVKVSTRAPSSQPMRSTSSHPSRDQEPLPGCPSWR